MSRARVSEFKGWPTFQIWPDDERARYPLISFGLRKAEAILEHLRELEKFVEDQGKAERPKHIKEHLATKDDKNFPPADAAISEEGLPF